MLWVIFGLKVQIYLFTLFWNFRFDTIHAELLKNCIWTTNTFPKKLVFKYFTTSLADTQFALLLYYNWKNRLLNRYSYHCHPTIFIKSRSHDSRMRTIDHDIAILSEFIFQQSCESSGEHHLSNLWIAISPFCTVEPPEMFYSSFTVMHGFHVKMDIFSYFQCYRMTIVSSTIEIKVTSPLSIQVNCH